jgi:hypothetical protein
MYICVFDWVEAVEQGRHQTGCLWSGLCGSHGRTTTPTLPAAISSDAACRQRPLAVFLCSGQIHPCPLQMQIRFASGVQFSSCFLCSSGSFNPLSLSLSLSSGLQVSDSIAVRRFGWRFCGWDHLGDVRDRHLRRWFGQARTLICRPQN